MNELTTYFKSKELIIKLKEQIDSLFQKKRLVFGRELIDLISNVTTDSFSESVVELLLENNVLVKKKAGSGINTYLLSLNKTKSDKYFLKEAEVAEILENTYIPILKNEDEFKVVFTAPEDPHFVKIDDMYLLYPAIKKLIQKSTKTLDIVNPFFDLFCTKKIIPDLLTVAKKGVSIRIISRGLFDANEGEKNREAKKLIMKEFKKRGLEKYISFRDYFKRDKNSSKQIFAVHSKLLVVDNDECYLGSANITATSLYSNFETGVIFNGKEVAKIKLLFNSLWDASRSSE